MLPRPEVLKGAASLVTGLTHPSELRPVMARFTGPDLSWQGELLVPQSGTVARQVEDTFEVLLGALDACLPEDAPVVGGA